MSRISWARNAKAKSTRPNNGKRVTFRLPVKAPRIMPKTNNLRKRNKKVKKKIKSRRKVRHMEWNELKESFVQTIPHQPPRMKVTASMMTKEHQEFGIKCDNRHSPTVVSAVADTGCLTTSSGVNIIKELNIPVRFLIPTK